MSINLYEQTWACIYTLPWVRIIFDNLLSFIVFAYAERLDYWSSLQWTENKRQT